MSLESIFETSEQNRNCFKVEIELFLSGMTVRQKRASRHQAKLMGDYKLEAKDIVTLSLSGSSFALSLLAIYLSHFRRSKISASLGPNIHLYYFPPNMLGIYLPVVFYNNSPTRSIVHKVFLEISDTKDNNFALSWLTSNEIDKANNYIEKGPAAPFKIDGYEAITNALQFAWHNFPGIDELQFLEGDYTARLHVWTSTRLRPDVAVTERFEINVENAKVLAENRAKEINTTRFFPLSGKGIISFTTGNEPVDFANLATP
jgi:hypothetical protein